MNIIRLESYEMLSKAAANILAAQVILKPDCVLGLATGSTPIGAYEILAKKNAGGEADFSNIKTVNLDEYCGLDKTHPQSYRYFMDKNLFSKINIDRKNTYVPDGTADDKDAECLRYDRLIHSLGGIDMQLLGIGHNGHVGFNEPGDFFVKPTHVVSLNASTIEANARFFNSADEVPKSAITMGIGSIMAAKKVLLLVSGQEKKAILEKALYGDITPQVPASLLQLHSDLTVICCVD